MLGWLRRLCGGWLGEINIKAKLSPAELKLGLSLAKTSESFFHVGCGKK